MLQPRRRPSLTQGPGLATNSNLHSREEPTLFPISARARNPAPQRRQADDSSDPPVTRVVQTVSIIQYVNSDGSPRGTSTHYAQPQTVLADPVTGDIIGPADDASVGVGAFDTPETPEPASSPEAANSPVPVDSDVPDAPQTPVTPDDSDVPDAPQSPDDPDTPDTQLPDDAEPSETPLPAVPPPVPESSEAPESLESPEPSEAATPTDVDLTPSADSTLADLPSILPSESQVHLTDGIPDPTDIPVPLPDTSLDDILPSTDGIPDPTDIFIPLPDTSLDSILPSTTVGPSSTFPTLEPSLISGHGGYPTILNVRVPQTNKLAQASITARLLAASHQHSRKVPRLPLSFRPPRRQTPLPNPPVWSLLRHTLHLVAAAATAAAAARVAALAEAKEEALGGRRSTVRHQTTTMARRLQVSWSAAWSGASRERHY